MTIPAEWIALAAVVVLAIGLLLIISGRGLRRYRGLGEGKTVSLDNVTLTSRRLRLIGRPDRLIKAGGTIVPEEWKSSQQLRPWHKAQLGVYFLLIEDQLGVRPTHGFIVCGDGSRHRVENTAELRDWVVSLAAEVRAARARVDQAIIVQPVAGQCPPCGMRQHCGQARL